MEAESFESVSAGFGREAESFEFLFLLNLSSSVPISAQG